MATVLEVHVSTVDGTTTTHRYPLPDIDEDEEEAFKVAVEIMERVRKATTARTSYLLMHFPFVAYQAVHVVRVELDIPKIVEQRVEKRMGFPTS